MRFVYYYIPYQDDQVEQSFVRSNSFLLSKHTIGDPARKEAYLSIHVF